MTCRSVNLASMSLSWQQSFWSRSWQRMCPRGEQPVSILWSLFDTNENRAYRRDLSSGMDKHPDSQREDDQRHDRAIKFLWNSLQQRLPCQRPQHYANTRRENRGPRRRQLMLFRRDVDAHA